MAKSKDEIKTPQTEREARWAEFLERYKKQNPEKYAARLAAGELKTIPSDF